MYEEPNLVSYCWHGPPGLDCDIHCLPLGYISAFCVMNGVTFAQGQVLNDGCSQRCRCDDASTNYYNCYDR